MAKVLGIDLGTTNSCMSSWKWRPGGFGKQRRRPHHAFGGCIYQERRASRRPSGKRQAVTNSQNTVFSIKRFMGRKFDEVHEESIACLTKL